MSVTRWEDDASVWTGPSYVDQAIAYHPDVSSAPVAGRIITCVDVVDWDGDGGRDLLLSSWDTCYEGRVFVYPQIGTKPDGTPILGGEQIVEGVRGYVTAVRDGDRFHLLSVSRMRRQIYLFPNTGTAREPRFGNPVVLDLEADWVKGNEYFHMARFHDIDGDGVPELVVGTDSWDDYWPNGLEWNDVGYRAYDAAGRWLGGPLRGFLYAFKNTGTLSAPVLGRGRPVLGGETPLEVYGQCAPAFGDFTGDGRDAVICGEFWNILHFARQTGPSAFEQPKLVADTAGAPVLLDQCIHLPCAVDWDGDGRLDILVGAEDGYVTFLRNIGTGPDGRPAFEKIGRVEGVEPSIHAGVLPSPAAHDFSGNGLPDLVVGNSTGELLFYENLGPREAPGLAREVMIEAGGKPVRIAAGLTGSIQGPSEKMFGYSCPTIADWDGDGLPDLLVSDVNGHHNFYRNDGGRVPPRFEAPRPLTWQGKPLKTVWRVRPAVIDWLGDGQLHYLALDEDGVLSDFRRASDTELADKRHLRWEDGTQMRFTQDVGGGRGRVKLCAVDWTGDGRIDLVIGTHARASVPPGPAGQPRNTTGQAGIFLLKNIGSNAEPAFAFPKAFRFRGETIQMAMHVASPEAVDWDGSGKLGLLVGVEDGSLVWLKRDDLSW
ncbi:FG-GAP repeat-containing protein [Nitratireductor indicus C115]|uniref:FG-GAP repeat-containing protein n=1 Tax=Nitratireductor indicus C115 TaxID=1231190 RepID=K2N6P8_9HYPH|nr:FG-GAP repeat-containing protein [Nitratireductor indicus C115]SFQ53156.1 Repeat domain-containing protein [Nitratireductor indicus]